MGDLRSSDFVPLTVGSRFEIVGKLGQGAVGLVYEAIDRERGARVALKMLRAPQAETILLLKDEFRQSQGLDHPNLVTPRELFEDDGQWFFAMDLVEGTDFLSYVRPRGRLDEPRLRSALGQLVAALCALHADHKVHRDVKPSNVLVEANGRVKLVDFGIVSDLAGRRGQDEGRLVGTVSYMAPEQAGGEQVTPAADWYALGVMLYQALTGSLPFVGPTDDVIARKWAEVPPPPAQLDPRVPPDLDELCTDLQRIDPTERPEGYAILRRLGVTEGAAGPAVARAGHFVGRREELQAMEDAFTRVCAGEAVTLLVEGESGVGKTALVRELTGRLIARDDALVLRGRCYERDALPYKAVDSLIDDVSRYIASLPDGESRSLLPEDAGALRATFPVIEVIGAMRAARVCPVDADDPQEARARMFAAIRALFANVARHRPTVLVIDDLQWADEDSFALLAEILRPPGAPPLLLLASIRTSSEPATTERRADRSRARIAAGARHLQLAPLPGDDARALIRQLIPADEASSSVVEGIYAEAKGHPMFIDELVRHRAALEPATSVRLDDALWDRASRLPADARTLLELIAVAGMPTRQKVIAKAAALDIGRAFDSLGVLRTAHFVRTSGAYRDDTVEPYHDRVRESVLSRLDPATRKEWHGRLALALEQAGTTEPERLIVHWRGAGESARAAEYAIRAADASVKALAFDHAASLYRTALEIHGHADDVTRGLHAKLGGALASSGYGVAAARAFQVAAIGSPPAGALVLRRQAAEQLLRAGQLDEGLDAVRALLAEVGMRLPASSLVGLMHLLLWRALLWLRGVAFVERDASEIAPHDLERLDVCWAIASGLGVIDTFRASAFQARHLVLALRAGEPFRVARALAVESVYVGISGEATWPRTEAAMARAEALASRLGRRDAGAFALFTRGFTHHLAARSRATISIFEQVQPLLRHGGSGMHWEIGTSQAYLLTNLVWCGELRKVCELRPLYLREAIDRGDLYTAFNLRTGHRAFVHLVADDPASVQTEVADALRDWSKDGFHMEHMDANLATINAQLYAGTPKEAYATLRESWPRLARSFLLRIELIRVWSFWDRGRCALAVAEAGGADASALVTRAERDARALERECGPRPAALAKLLRAGAANVRIREHPATRLQLEEAVAALAAADMQLHVASARRCLGVLVGGEEGRALVETADTWMMGQGVRSPARMAAAIAPGFRR